MSEVMTPPVDQAENGAIRQMREQIANLEAARKDAEAKAAESLAKATELEREKLTEIDRLKAEREEYKTKAEEGVKASERLASVEKTLESQYNAKLLTIPDPMRAAVAQISQHGTFADRLSALDAAVSLMAPATPARPSSAGTPTSPVMPGAVAALHEPAKPVDPKDWGKIAVGQELREMEAARNKTTPVGNKVLMEGV